MLESQCLRFSSNGFLVSAILYVQNKTMGILKLASLAVCQHYHISVRDGLANLICILSHVPDTWEVAVYWRAISIPLSSCLSIKFAHHNENELQNWKKRGCLAAWQCLCSSVAALWWVSAPMAQQYAFQTFWRAWKGSSISPTPAGGTPLAHSRCKSGIYSSPWVFLPDSNADKSSSGLILHQ